METVRQKKNEALNYEVIYCEERACLLLMRDAFCAAFLIDKTLNLYGAEVSLLYKIESNVNI